MHEFPEGLRHYVDDAPQIGRVEAILVRPEKRADVQLVDSWTLGDPAVDHGAARDKRQVTLIQSEHISTIGSLLGRDVPWTTFRRNILVSGLNLEACLRGEFSVGDTVLRGTQRCDPCNRMETILGPGGYLSMLGHGGICASVVTTGTIKVGDVVRWRG
jgi:MOSC domain-containing protein YiiM